MPARTLDLEASYFSKVERGAANECWPWIAGRTSDGYGAFRSGLAHRWGYEHFVGPTNGLDVCHTCDNPPCQNPSHWFLGTRGQNNADRHSKGRSRGGSRPGTTNGLSRLTEEIVVEARRRWSAGGCSSGSLAKEYGVSQPTMHKALVGQTWKHV